MYYIENKCTDPRYNLAFEEYVFKHLDKTHEYLLLWQNAPSVIVGRFQNTVSEINMPFVTEHDIPVVRRITGGGAVYHDLGNLNFSFIANTGTAEIDFLRFTSRIADALSSIGIEAAHSGRNDITIDGRKFSGNAQLVHKNRLLHHGTIMISSALSDVACALNVSAEKIASKGVKSVKSRVTNINEHAKTPLTANDFRGILLKHLFPAGVSKYTLSVRALSEIEALSRDKYRTWEWNFGASPEYAVERRVRCDGGEVEVRYTVIDGVIVNLKIYGDFFGSADISELSQSLIGMRRKKEDIAEALARVNLSIYMKDIPAEILIDLLTQ